MASLDDQLLIDLSRGGDLDAFNALVERYQNAVYSVALRMCGNRAAAEDLTQNTFISAFQNIVRFRDGNFRAWLLRIARNATYDYLRRSKRGRELTVDEDVVSFAEIVESPAPGPEEQVLTAELGEAISQGLAELSADHRLSVVLVDIEGYKYEEAAEAMGVSLGTVKSRLNRARRQLRDFLKARPELLPGGMRL